MKRCFLLPVLPLLLAACMRLPEPAPLTTIFLTASPVPTRSMEPDEALITDYNLLIFNSFGLLEEKVFYSSRQLKLENGRVCYRTRLLQDTPYTFLAAANLGYELPCRTLEEALAYRYHMAYPDEFTPGIPMAAVLERVCTGADGQLELPLQRLMARIDLQMDRRALDTDVAFTVREVRVGGSPSSVQLFGQSKAESATQVFREGFIRSGEQVNALNREETLGLSGQVSVYLLENCQGDLLEHVMTDSGKVFSDGRYKEVCSYIEIRAEYHAPRRHTQPNRYLIYRFYLGENLNNFDVFRNTRYRITVRPEGDGLQEDNWRIDKSGLEEGAE